MQSTQNQVFYDFPERSSKPGTYSVIEKPKQCDISSKTLAPIPCRQPTGAEKAYDTLTSLPVTTGLLALVLSQGASLDSTMWYLNYLAVSVILLIGIAVVLSYLSVPCSHRFCETVFLTIYTPVSQIFNISASVRDIHEDEFTIQARQSKQEASPLLKQSLLVATALAATHGLSIVSLAYLALATATFKCLSIQLKAILPSTTNGVLGQSSPFDNKATLIPYGVIVGGTITLTTFTFTNGLAVFLAGLYFVASDTQTRDWLKTTVENKGIEVMEGLEEYFTEGVLQLSEILLTLAVALYNPYICLIYAPTFYFNIYCPSVAFLATSRKIRAESLCLSVFQKATSQEIEAYDDVCAVCLSGMTHARVTSCKHIFHGKCLKDCLQKKPCCPMCNAQLL